MHQATDTPGFGYGERWARTQQQSKGKANMSAKAFAACRFEPAAEQTVAADYPAPEGIAAEIEFGQDLWREYRREAVNAGFSAAEAVDYACALIPEVSHVVGMPAMARAGRGWFYQSRISLVRRTFNSGLVTLRRWEKSKTVGRTGAPGALRFAPWFRPWNAGRKG
jgi:hypothetical protein